MIDKIYRIYFMTSENNNALYIGITSNLEKRIYEHKNDLIDDFTKNHKLIYFEDFNDPKNAILREKQLKRWIRKKKNALVNKSNPEWKDLSLDWYLDPSTSLRSAQDDRKAVNE